MKSGSLQNQFRDKTNDDANENNISDYYKMNNEKTTASKSFQYKTELIASTPNNNSALHTEVVISLKCLSDF